MPSVQQVKRLILGCLLVFAIITQTAVQIHLSYNSIVKGDSKEFDNVPSESELLSEGYRLKRSLSRLSKSVELDDNSLTETLQKPEGTVPPLLTLTTVKFSDASSTLSSSLPVLSSSSSSSPSLSSESSSSGPQDMSRHVTNWSAVPDHLFIHHYYVGNFSRQNVGLCERKKKLTLLILVTTAIDHFSQRNSVRQTWGHFGLRADVQFAFVVGDSLLHQYNESIRAAFEEELNLYDDFIVAEFEDKYRNLAIKTLHMLDWISTYCQNAEYFLKTDDDVFLNVPQILEHIHNVKDGDKVVPKIYGHVFSGHLPSRNQTHRHLVGFDVYPYNLTYPNFTSGPAYLMSTRIVRPLFHEVLKLPFVPLEDVLTTGFAAMNLGIPRVDIQGFHNEMKNPSDFTACELISIFAGMTDGSAVQMNYVWFNYLMGRTLCTWKEAKNKFNYYPQSHLNILNSR